MNGRMLRNLKELRKRGGDSYRGWNCDNPDGQYRNQTDYILCSQRWRSSIQSAKTRLGADCGSGHELLIAKFRLKFKKVGKTTRPFRYDLNQIPYSGSDKQIQWIRSDRQSAWRTPDRGLWHCTGAVVIKTIPKEKKCKKAKWLSEEALQIAEKRWEVKGKVEKER